MSDSSKLSRRERQIMDILYARGEATVRQLQDELPDPPTPMAIRGALRILEDKALLKRRKEGREVVYSPKQPKGRAGSKALSHVLDTFFEGSVQQALTSHFSSRKSQLTDEEYQELLSLIDEARKKGR